MSAAGHGGLSPRALSRTHVGKPISRNGCFCTLMDSRFPMLSRALQINFPLLLYITDIIDCEVNSKALFVLHTLKSLNCQTPVLDKQKSL